MTPTVDSIVLTPKSRVFVGIALSVVAVTWLAVYLYNHKADTEVLHAKGATSVQLMHKNANDVDSSVDPTVKDAGIIDVHVKNNVTQAVVKGGVDNAPASVASQSQVNAATGANSLLAESIRSGCNTKKHTP